MSRRRRILVALTLLTALVGGACSVSTDDEPVALSGDLFEPLTATTTTTTTPTDPGDGTKLETVYFLRIDDGVAEIEGVERVVDIDAGVQEILGNLFTVRPDGVERGDERGLTSSIPESAVLLSANLIPGTNRLVVDVQGLFGDDGIQGTDLRNALAQIVWTASSNDDVGEVVFQNNGNDAAAITGTGETADGPVTRGDYPRTLG